MNIIPHASVMSPIIVDITWMGIFPILCDIRADSRSNPAENANTIAMARPVHNKP